MKLFAACIGIVFVKNVQSAKIEATAQGDLLATFDSAENTVLIKQGDEAPVNIMEELKVAKRASAENAEGIEGAARGARAVSVIYFFSHAPIGLKI